MPRKPAQHASKTDRSTTDRTEARPPVERPTFDTLDREACDALLARHHVGRLAYSFRDRVDVEPIGYAFEEGWIYGRTSPGSKITAIQHNPWVAFEVDEVRGPFEWESVVVHGSLYTFAPGGTNLDQQAWDRGREALQRLLPDAWTDVDPTPFRTIPFGIHIADITGRRARMQPSDEPEP